MEILQLRYFFESAKNESFTKTAEKFMVPPSSVSASVRLLENSLYYAASGQLLHLPNDTKDFSLSAAVPASAYGGDHSCLLQSPEHQSQKLPPEQPY